jgi:hypothetical protein
MKKQSLEQTAIITLQDCLKRVPFLKIERIEPSGRDCGLDFMVWARFQDQPRLLLVRVKNNGQPRLAVYELKDSLAGKSDAYGIFIATYISPDAGKICEDAGIG